MKLYTGSVDAGMKIFKQHGVGGVWKGFVATVVRDAPFFGFYFMFYEIFANMLQGDEPGPVSAVNGFMAGGFTGILSWVMTFPTDSLKSISQTEPLEQNKRLYSGYLNMCKTVVAKDGFGKLYNGLFVCALRGFPVNAVTFLCYEQARSTIQNFRGK